MKFVDDNEDDDDGVLDSWRDIDRFRCFSFLFVIFTVKGNYNCFFSRKFFRPWSSL